MTSGKAVKSLGRVWDRQDSCTVSRTRLVTIMIAVKSLGRVWRPTRWLLNLLEGSEYHQDSCTVSERSGGQQDNWEVSKTSLWTSRMASESLGRALGPAG